MKILELYKILNYPFSIFNLPTAQKQRSSHSSGKIILSGEYAVVFGKRGIALPSKLQLKATLSISQKNDGITIIWEEKKNDRKWMEYVRKVVDEIMKREGLNAGQVLIESEIPLGKGMGSSTALVIALTRLLVSDENKQRQIALEVEDIVNPGHSGLDFAVIWEQKPILFQKEKDPTAIDLPLINFELIDTGTPNETTKELVAWMKSEKERDSKRIESAFEIIDRCTERILNGEPIKPIIREHHRAQIMLGVVPEATQKLIADIEKNGGAAKVIGAGARTGGGGMVLFID